MYHDEELEEERVQELSDARLDQPAACFICGRPACKYGCFRCGLPVCHNQENYFLDSTCGAWILDTWHPGHPDENEFYCKMCLHAGLIPASGLTIARITFKAEKGALQIVVGGTPRPLSNEEAADLIAYLFDNRGELFGKPYNPDAEEEHELEPVAVTSENEQDDSLGSLDDHPF